MSTKEAVAAFDALLPNAYPEMQKLRWLYTLDLLICREILAWHGEEPEIGAPYDLEGERELLVSAPYCSIYLDYLSAMAAMYNSEYEAYANAMLRFNSGYSAFADHYNRSHLPRQDYRLRV